ncbi:MAG: excinuclease ABC subunit UvrA [Elusimicrobiaceae bacterium]|nr:excinuclease ABC subunit UvrA [Elusimicrobiaceae bacterium]
MDNIIIRGARQHNLKNISLSIPRDRMTVITGLSGSGKSSLAFDTIYAEGQRRYVESLSAYARQFLGLMEKPDVDHIEGLSPAISIEQRNPSRNPRSTVATVTEIYDYFRLLFARAGRPQCPKCGRAIETWSAQGIVQDILARFAGRAVYIFAPVIRGRKGSYEEVFSKYRKAGFIKARVDGVICELASPPVLARYKKHDIELLVDDLAVEPADRERLADSVEAAVRHCGGLVMIEARAGGKKAASATYSESSACAHCGISFPELEPRLFSFNSPHGACPACTGLGVKMEAAEDLVIPDPGLSIDEGALAAWASPVTTRTHRWTSSWSSYYMEILKDVCEREHIPTDVPWNKLSKTERGIILYGGGQYRVSWASKDKNFEGVIGNLRRRYEETESEFVREEIFSRFMRETTCAVCGGARLKPEALSVLVGGKNIAEVTALSVDDCLGFFKTLRLDDRELLIARQILKEINARIGFLANVGLNYLTLDRRSESLSGGEAQRIHLATQIGSGLTGVLYVLDEPTIGLHSRDNRRLLDTLKTLRDSGNTLVIVEHDEETIREADHIVDLGPGAGEYGGEIIAEGSLEKILKSKKSLTAAYLNGACKIPVPAFVRPGHGRALRIRGARQFNLKNIDVEIPLGKLVCVTGVSGSGKSTLVHEILYKALARELNGAKDIAGKHDTISGMDKINKVIIVDQSPIGRTPRSNPATYTGVFTEIRQLFAKLPEARRRGFEAGRFSFNVKGGRCEKCQGDGIIKIQMQFLPDIYVKCEECGGRRFNEDTLSVKYKGHSISDVLEMSVSRALEIMSPLPRIAGVLKTLEDVGLGYIKLGQSATTLSGGEAQRVKLATELSRRATGRTLYILDEPTTGLHFADIDKLLGVLHRLADAGNTVLIIEHNLDVIKTADHIIDMGPEGGDKGGFIVATGTPREVAGVKRSYTGQYLKEIFADEKVA